MPTFTFKVEQTLTRNCYVDMEAETENEAETKVKQGMHTNRHLIYHDEDVKEIRVLFIVDDVDGE